MQTAFFLIAPIVAGLALFATDLVALFHEGSLARRIAIVVALCLVAAVLLAVARDFGP